MSASSNVKTGVFVFLTLLLLVYATLKISGGSLVPGGSRKVYIVVNSATGISEKTPIEVAGIQVGEVVDIDLVDNNRARLTLSIKKKVKIAADVQARIKTTGFLGDTYIELYQPQGVLVPLEDGATITSVQSSGDINSLTTQLSDIANDVKAITSTMRGLMAGEDSSFARSLRNIEQITESLKNVSTANEGNLNVIIANLRELSGNLNTIVARNEPNVDATLDNIALITDKIKRGEGTVGKLINDDATAEKINDTLDNINGLLGNAGKLKADLGYHSEYLGTSGDFKHYVSVALKTRPDKAFLIDLVSDPDPDSSFITKKREITSGGTTTTVTEKVETEQSDKFRISAQLAKQFYDFTFRGGIIESSGGVGLDYKRGPVGIKFSAFDFETKRGERPHLKAMGTMNLTKNFYLLGGMDDFISKEQDPDWFMGAGLNFTDDDVKSLIGLAGMKP